MQLKVSEEITGKWQNQRSETNMSHEYYFASRRDRQLQKLLG